MESETNPTPLRLALPKGRTQESVLTLLREARIRVDVGQRGYRPQISLPGVDAKILKPQNVVEMLHAGTRDIGFAGADWVAELDSELVEVLDTGLDAVRLVAAAPPELLENGKLPGRRLRVASEFERLTKGWIEDRALQVDFVRTFGATEVFPPDDADCVVDLVSTGSTLRANNLVEFDEVLRSSTRLYANPRVLDDPAKRERIDQFVLVLDSVLQARRRVMLELNVTSDRLDAVVAMLPCMREPTISQLASDSGYALRAAVSSDELPTLIPSLKAAGGTDLCVTSLSQIVP